MAHCLFYFNSRFLLRARNEALFHSFPTRDNVDPVLQLMTKRLLATFKEEEEELTEISWPDLLGNLVVTLGVQPKSITKPDLDNPPKYSEFLWTRRTAPSLRT